MHRIELAAVATKQQEYFLLAHTAENQQKLHLLDLVAPAAPLFLSYCQQIDQRG